jgi:hypothetical protein
MSHAHMRRRIAAAGVVAAALASVVGCGSQSGAIGLPSGSGASPTPSSASSTPSPTGTAAEAAKAAQQALTAYRAAFADWTAVESVANKADYQNPQLANHLTGAALSSVTSAVYINTNVKGGVTHGQPVLLDPTVGAMTPAGDPTQVVVTDCVSTQNWLLFTTDGRLYNDVPGGRDKTQAVVTYAAGTWKVSQLVIQTNGSC